MLHRQLLDRFLIAAGVLAVWALAAPAVGVARADDPQVTVIAASGAQQTLSLEALAGREDVVGRSYVVRTSDGESTQTISGFSLGAILEAAGADPYAFSYLEVLRPAGGAVLLSRDQALDGEGFADGPPTVYAAASGTAFLRPSSGPDDVNASDSFEAPQGVTVALRKGQPLRVRARASTLRTRPGKVVRFEALIDRAGSGEQLTYSWYFDDGHSASGPSARHSFAQRGNYDVVIGITTASDSTGASAVVTIQVGAPLPGPDRKGGGRRRATDAPDHGAATGAESAGPTAGAGAAPSPEPSRRTTKARLAQRAKRQPAIASVPAGERISGRLLSVSEPAAAEASARPEARTGSLSSDEGGGPNLPDAALALLVTAGLIGLGALIEGRSLLG
jgi:hypothetical protein